jgi:predicted small integral membrane protein
LPTQLLLLLLLLLFVWCLHMCVWDRRVFLHKEGLVRFCTTPYKKPAVSNLGCSYMHLTNYAVNKHNTAAFVAPTAAAAAAAGVAPVVSSSGGGSNSSSGTQEQQQQQQQQQQQGTAAAEAGGDSDGSSKWSFQQLRQHLEAQGGCLRPLMP